MTKIRLRNTKTRKTEEFIPLDPQNVRLYLCGPTVYDRAHIGNARNVIMFDVLFRLLRHVYGEAHVTYVRNFTDVDDKINDRARETGRSISEITAETTQWYLDDMAALGNLEPTHMPRATAYIPQMVTMIEDLIAKGHAYEASGHVLFDVRSYPAYGRLSGRSVDDMIAGARVEVAPYKRDPMDFVLWKPSDAETPGWDSPWGRGRPGWHIECSAMSLALLGESFDIHGGGLDLQFPHHENELAQSACAHPKGEFARVWLHNEMLQVGGKKMSKSLGNFFTVRDLIEKFEREFAIQNIGPAIRLRFLQAHYRSQIDFQQSYIEAAATKLGTWAFWIGESIFDEKPEGVDIPREIIDALCDDLNTPQVVSHIDSLVSELRKPIYGPMIDIEADRKEFVAWQARLALEFLGFDLKSMNALRHESWSQRLKERSSGVTTLVERLLAERDRARKEKNFSRADVLRDGFAEAGLIVKDTAVGTTWELSPGFDPSKLDALK